MFLNKKRGEIRFAMTNASPLIAPTNCATGVPHTSGHRNKYNKYIHNNHVHIRLSAESSISKNRIVGVYAWDTKLRVVVVVSCCRRNYFSVV